MLIREVAAKETASNVFLNMMNYRDDGFSPIIQCNRLMKITILLITFICDQDRVEGMTYKEERNKNAQF